MLNNQRAAELSRRHFAIEATAVPLDGEFDLNFALTSANARYVLKVHASGTDASELEFQNALLDWLATHAPDLPAPRIVKSVEDTSMVEVDIDGQLVTLRCLTWLEGELWSQSEVDTLQGPFSLGEYLARLDITLASFVHRGADRRLAWDMRDAGRLRQWSSAINPVPIRCRVDAILARFEESVRPVLMSLPAQVIHNDANDNNIVLDERGQVLGLIDYGDAVLGHRVTEIAVACAYAMIASRDPFAVAAKVVAGYHATSPLSAEEVALIPDLIETRIAMSISMAAHQHATQPDNDYLLISQRSFHELIKRLEGENRELAHYRLRDACGFSSQPNTPVILDWLRAHRSSFASICSHDLSDPANLLILDLSSDGEHAEAMAGMESTEAFTRYIFQTMASNGAAVGVGRYLEKRAVYRSAAYQTLDPDERRDRHLGVDLFIAPGEPVYSALDGVVEGVANNDAALDFGPTVILRHETDDGTPFWTLYGHLSLETLDHLRIGQPVNRGDLVGWVGDYPHNGDWPPHLHFQIMTTLLGMGTAIHGVGNDALLDVWESVFPDPGLMLPLPVSLRAGAVRGVDYLRLKRRINLGRMLRLAYTEPLKIVRGSGQYLYDDAGNRYLDMVNNVCHVGHCHPAVVAAGQQQMATLNTNTRYLHDNIVELARRLAGMLPDPLSVCFFVNSGSEANDLALRLARSHTGAQDILVLEQAYHGHLSALIDISPYKFDRRGGGARPARTHVCTLPDTYRGAYRRDQADVAHKYAASVRGRIDELATTGLRPAAFIAESLGGVSGQMILPTGYLKAAYDHVRTAGGVCIADEVQVGLGRMGTAMWGFQTQGVVPDIVTIGKPLGNGHPLAAVVTTSAIAQSFNTGMEYFNTFGGNPVSCAIGLAVLSAIDTDGLMDNARVRGEQLMGGLWALARHHPLIGDVRGIGLFIGAELVRDRDTLEPATTEARELVEYVKTRGILLSTDGHHDNVLKIKPPMCLDAEDVAFFLTCLDEGLRRIGQKPQ